MSFLDNLTQEQRNTLIRLPYRVGLYVSSSDDTGGEGADEAEREALSNILHGFAAHVFGAESVQFIMSETVQNEEQWSDWGHDLSNIGENCRIALDLLRLYIDDKEISAFKNHLMEIAEAVALSFKEYKAQDTGFKKALRYLSYKAASPGMARKRSFEEYSSISPAERRALHYLAKVLNTTYA